jgi:hypothetical protein
MKVFGREVNLTHVLAGAALIVSVISQGAYAAEVGNPRVFNFVRWLSFMIFGGTIFLLMQDIARQFRELKEEHQRAAADQKRLHEMSLRALNIAQTTMHSADAERWSAEHPDAIHVDVCNRVATYLLKDYTSALAEGIHRSTREPDTRHITVPDYSPIHDLTGSLAERLPNGGVWLGITLVDDERAWSSADQLLNEFAHTTRTRAQAEEITVLRLYNFGADGPSAGMRRCLRREHASKIRVRYRTVVPPIRDISLLYAPPANGASSPPPTDEDVTRTLREAGYTLICAVQYDTREGGALRNARIYAPEHDHTRELLREFDNLWAKATVFSEEQPAEDG